MGFLGITGGRDTSGGGGGGGNVNVLTPIDGVASDVANFNAYAATQISNNQPIFLADPNGVGFVFDGGITNADDSMRCRWIGVVGASPNAPVLIKWSGINTVLVGAGITGCKFEILGGDQTFQGFSEHCQVDCAELMILNASTVTFQAVNFNCARISVNGGVAGDITLSSRSYVKCQNFDNGGTIATKIINDATLETVQGDGDVEITGTGGKLLYNNWTTDDLSITGNQNYVFGNEGFANFNLTSAIECKVDTGIITGDINVNGCEKLSIHVNNVNDYRELLNPSFDCEININELDGNTVLNTSQRNIYRFNDHTGTFAPNGSNNSFYVNRCDVLNSGAAAGSFNNFVKVNEVVRFGNAGSGTYEITVIRQGISLLAGADNTKLSINLLIGSYTNGNNSGCIINIGKQEDRGGDNAVYNGTNNIFNVGENEVDTNLTGSDNQLNVANQTAQQIDCSGDRNIISASNATINILASANNTLLLGLANTVSDLGSNTKNAANIP